MPTKIAPIQLPSSTALGLYADRDPIAVEATGGDEAGPNEAMAFSVRRDDPFGMEHDFQTGLHNTGKIARAVVVIWWDNNTDTYSLSNVSGVNETTLEDDPGVLTITRLAAGKVKIDLPDAFGYYAIQDLSRAEIITGDWEWVRCDLVDYTSTSVTVERFTSGPWKDGDMAFALFAV